MVGADGSVVGQLWRYPVKSMQAERLPPSRCRLTVWTAIGDSHGLNGHHDVAPSAGVTTTTDRMSGVLRAAPGRHGAAPAAPGDPRPEHFRATEQVVA